MMDNIFSERLQALQTQGLYRKMANMHSGASATASIDGKTCDIFCSNNYLTLANHPDMISKIKAGLDQWGFGTGSSRLINGNTTAHINLQHRLATLLGQEDALIFPTGFMTNYGLLSVIGREGDLIIFDKLAHASIIDGAMASKATVRSFPHKNYDRLIALLEKKTYKNIYIVSDSIFSMDGDFADITQLVAIKNKYSATLIIDEAHAFGATGPDGLGVSHLQGVLNDIDVYVATFSKALGGAGGFIAANNTICQMLINHSRSFIYTTGLPAINCIAADAALDIISREPQRQKALWHNCDYFKKRCQEKGLSHGDSDSYIIPIFIGEASRALAISEALLEKQLMVSAIRPPTVAPGSSRLRISILNNHTKPALDYLCDTLVTLIETIKA
jgi:8-amino-7-oxononanoate synthase